MCVVCMCMDVCVRCLGVCGVRGVCSSRLGVPSAINS